MELVVVTAVISIVLVGFCEVYLATVKELQRQSGANDALMAASAGCSRPGSYIAQCRDAVALSRFDDDDALAVNMPADTAGGIYVPVRLGGALQYRTGSWIVFYLSDSTGDYSRSGKILWAGTCPSMTGFPASLMPDASWSLYYGSTAGRTMPIDSLSVIVNEGDGRMDITVSAVSSYKIGETTKQVTVARTFCARNYPIQ